MNVLQDTSRTYRWLSLLSGQQTVPIGQTPRELVYTRDRLQVFRYVRETPATQEVPILLVYSLINRPSILDLLPQRSVVRALMAQGFEVYLLDWGVPDGLDRFAGLDTYVNLYLRTAVRQVCRHAGTAQVNLFGYCMGGTMAAMFTALHPQRVHKLLLLGAPFHFRSEEMLYRWGCDPSFFEPDDIVDACGNAPPWAFEGFSLLKADQKLPRYALLYDKANDDAFIESHLAMEQWVNGNIPMAGAVYSEFLHGCFHDNRLITGELQVGDRTVDLSRITCPTLLITGDSDHLVPSETSTPLGNAVRDVRVIRFPSGHVGLSVSGAAHKKLWPEACNWLATPIA